MSDDEKNKDNDSFEEIDRKNSDDEKIREDDDDKFNLFIKQITGNSTMITCSPTEKISRVKELIAEKLSINANSQRLMYQNKQLDDDKTLIDYDIQSNSTIHLILRLHGGLI
jgi:hypothetical protein